MCGIAGFYTLQSSYSEALLRTMTDALQHRGPDASGYFFKETIGLGHRRLSILDLSAAANQPMYSADGRYIIIFNGEVYNFREIAQQLNLKTKTTSDTEVILEAIAMKGPEAVNLFNGMFALAVYDKHEHTLFLFRDRFGVKPLFYSHEKGNFFFASELKALLKVPEIKAATKINHQAIHDFLHLGYIPEPHTIYKNIFKFPAGHYAILKGEKLEIKRYWSPEEKIQSELIRDENQVLQELEELLLSSVKYRLISDVPYGIFLSGGVDSSLVTSMACKATSARIKTFSIGFAESHFNESVYAEKVAKHLGTDHHEFILTQSDALPLFEKIIDVYDEPFADNSAVPTQLVSAMSRKHVTMVLTGDGGDENFMGYGSYKWAGRLKNPLLYPFRKPISKLLATGSSRYKRVGDLLNYESDTDFYSHVFSQENNYFTQAELKNILSDEMTYRNFETLPVSLKRKLTPAEQQALYDMKYYLRDDLLVKMDRASMRFSLEAREPLLDYRIAEYSLNIDPALKMKDGKGKYPLRKILSKYVPQEYYERPKWGFTTPLMDWLSKELKVLLDHYTSETVVNRHGYMDASQVANLRKRYLAGEKHLFLRMWTTIMLHMFLEKEKANG